MNGGLFSLQYSSIVNQSKGYVQPISVIIVADQKKVSVSLTAFFPDHKKRKVQTKSVLLGKYKHINTDCREIGDVGELEGNTWKFWRRQINMDGVGKRRKAK